MTLRDMISSNHMPKKVQVMVWLVGVLSVVSIAAMARPAAAAECVYERDGDNESFFLSEANWKNCEGHMPGGSDTAIIGKNQTVYLANVVLGKEQSADLLGIVKYRQINKISGDNKIEVKNLIIKDGGVLMAPSGNAMSSLRNNYKNSIILPNHPEFTVAVNLANLVVTGATTIDNGTLDFKNLYNVSPNSIYFKGGLEVKNNGAFKMATKTKVKLGADVQFKGTLAGLEMGSVSIKEDVGKNLPLRIFSDTMLVTAEGLSLGSADTQLTLEGKYFFDTITSAAGKETLVIPGSSQVIVDSVLSNGGKIIVKDTAMLRTARTALNAGKIENGSKTTIIFDGGFFQQPSGSFSANGSIYAFQDFHLQKGSTFIALGGTVTLVVGDNNYTAAIETDATFNNLLLKREGQQVSNVSFQSNGKPSHQLIKGNLTLQGTNNIVVEKGINLEVLGSFKSDSKVQYKSGGKITNHATVLITDADSAPLIELTTVPSQLYVTVSDDTRNMDSLTSEGLTAMVYVAKPVIAILPGGVHKILPFTPNQAYDAELITLAETAPNSGIFRSTVPLNGQAMNQAAPIQVAGSLKPFKGNKVLEVNAASDLYFITAGYEDPADVEDRPFAKQILVKIPKVDLVVTPVSVEKIKPGPNVKGLFLIRYAVQNTGTGLSGPFVSKVAVNGTGGSGQYLFPAVMEGVGLNVNQTKVYSFIIDQAALDNLQQFLSVEVTVDKNNAVAESDEDNNTMILSWSNDLQIKETMALQKGVQGVYPFLFTVKNDGLIPTGPFSTDIVVGELESAVHYPISEPSGLEAGEEKEYTVVFDKNIIANVEQLPAINVMVDNKNQIIENNENNNSATFKGTRDLAVLSDQAKGEGISLSKDLQGNSYLTYSLINKGNTPTGRFNTNITFFGANVSANDDEAVGLLAGETKVYTKKIDPGLQFNEIILEVDNKNEVIESDEDNNRAVQTIKSASLTVPAEEVYIGKNYNIFYGGNNGAGVAKSSGSTVRFSVKNEGNVSAGAFQMKITINGSKMVQGHKLATKHEVILVEQVGLKGLETKSYSLELSNQLISTQGLLKPGDLIDIQILSL
ncbi:MAG: hypothetical protein EXS55_01225 [Candidatus Magasanikbacteria bacterium]|nr:hypothetical protein [Candidatus Magasanikbacteria bacterium]